MSIPAPTGCGHRNAQFEGAQGRNDSWGNYHLSAATSFGCISQVYDVSWPTESSAWAIGQRLTTELSTTRVDLTHSHPAYFVGPRLLLLVVLFKSHFTSFCILQDLIGSAHNQRSFARHSIAFTNPRHDPHICVLVTIVLAHCEAVLMCMNARLTFL